MRPRERPLQSRKKPENVRGFLNTQVVGGTRTGQVVLWDLRSPATLPAQRSPLDAAAPHARPVSKVVSRGDALASCSADGVVCYWTAAQLQRPVETHVLTHDGGPVAVSCVDFADPIHDDRDLVVGDERGRVYRAKLSGAGADVARLPGPPHVGLVATVKAHPAAALPAARAADALGLRRGLVASASVDWTAKVWGPGGVVASLDHGNHAYVVDAAWSPTRAPLLATCASTGDVALWSAAAARGGGRVGAAARLGDAPCTCLAFGDDGARLAVGDAAGGLAVLSLAAGVGAPDAAEDARFDALLAASTD